MISGEEKTEENENVVSKELKVFAQPGEDGAFVYREKGQKTILFDFDAPKTKELQIGSQVIGNIRFEDESKKILTPIKVDPPVQIEIKAEIGRDGMVIGINTDGRTALFYTESPTTPSIREGDTVKGVIIRDELTYIWVYPTELIRAKRELMQTGYFGKEGFHVHAFVPLILNEMIPVSQGRVRSEILGMKGPDQAFEDLIYATFEMFGCGIVTPLGYRVSGQACPDGDVFCPNREKANYLLLYDAKSRSGEPGYSMSLTDKRAFEDYLRDPKYTHIKKRAFIVISSSFSGEPAQLSGGTLTFFPAKVLALLTSWKVMNPTLVNEEVLEPLFFAGKIITEEDVRNWGKKLRLREIPI